MFNYKYLKSLSEESANQLFQSFLTRSMDVKIVSIDVLFANNPDFFAGETDVTKSQSSTDAAEAEVESWLSSLFR